MNNFSQFTPKKDDSHVQKQCTRFHSSSARLANPNSAIIYLKLRNDGCSKRKALNFSSKAYCRVDTTKDKDGPIDFKKLKVKKNPGTITFKGWRYENPEYELGKKFYFGTHDFLVNDTQSRYFEQHFGNHADRIKEDYKKKLLSLRDYFHDINSKCNFTKLTKEELYQKLKEENNLLRTQTKCKDNKQRGSMNFSSGQASSNWMHEDPNSKAMNIVNSYAFSFGTENNQNIEPVKNNYVSVSASTSYYKSPKEIDSVKEDLPSTAHGVRPTIKIDYINSESNVKTLETLKGTNNSLPDGENIGENDDNAGTLNDYREAYEELESHTNMLYHMTSQNYDSPPSEYPWKKKARSKPFAETGAGSTEDKAAALQQMEQKRIKNDDLAKEFNDINYFYMNRDGPDNAPGDSPLRRMKAKQLMNFRKQQRKLDKSIFDKIIVQQNHRTPQEQDILDPTNLENLKAKQDGIKTSIQKKIGMSPQNQIYLSSSYRGSGGMSPHSYVNCAPSVSSYFTKQSSISGTPRSSNANTNYTYKSKDVRIGIKSTTNLHGSVKDLKNLINKDAMKVRGKSGSNNFFGQVCAESMGMRSSLLNVP